MTTGFNWIEKDETENIKLIHDIVNTIFPQKELKELYMTILATGLDGIPLEEFVLANGGGGNGKGLLNELTQFMLGNYAYILPANILVGAMKQGNCPEIANMNNKRLVFVREPNPDLKFNCATIKEITGGGEINARLNYSNDCKTNLNMTFVLECNDKPKLNEVNDALMRRILDIPFKSKFVSKDIYETLEEEDKA
jgi:phage/plasmid-associated DNA primase